MRDRQFSTPGEARRYLVLQKKLARQKKGSTNRKKTVAALRQVKRRNVIGARTSCPGRRTGSRPDTGWSRSKTSRPPNMTRSAKRHRRGARITGAQKAGLNRGILGKGWHKLQLALENVARCTGTTIVKVPARTRHNAAQRAAPWTRKAARAKRYFGAPPADTKRTRT